MRTVQIGDEFIPGSIDIGNVGVFWNPDEDTGVTWMSVDRAGRFRAGAATCPHDIGHPQDGLINVRKLLPVFGAWSDANSPHDVDFNGFVDVFDIIEVLAERELCP